MRPGVCRDYAILKRRNRTTFTESRTRENIIAATPYGKVRRVWELGETIVLHWPSGHGHALTPTRAAAGRLHSFVLGLDLFPNRSKFLGCLVEGNLGAFPIVRADGLQFAECIFGFRPRRVEIILGRDACL